MDFIVDKMDGGNKRVLANFVYVHPSDFSKLVSMSGLPDNLPANPEATGILVKCRDFVYTVKPGDMEDEGCAAFNIFQRLSASLQTGRDKDYNPPRIIETAPRITLTPFSPSLENFALRALKLEYEKIDLDCEMLAALVKHRFSGQVFSVNQRFAVKHKFQNGKKLLLELKVISVDHLNTNSLLNNEGEQSSHASSMFSSTLSCGQLIQGVEGGHASENETPFEGGLDLKKMGIGGLDKEFDELRTRAFNTRLLPASWMRKLGHKHVRGILLYGPPGCGKTLIARKLAEALKAREPKIVQGPELLSKCMFHFFF
eukprot:GSMAST32.ASY1.ANO1.829.1 assembled CDS